MSTSTEAFDKYLENYQESMVKIIGKHRRPNHLLSASDLMGECNLAIISKKDHIINKLGADFNEVNFQRMAYTFIRNVIKWTHYRISGTPYVRKRVDQEHVTEDGYKTTYDLALASNGYDEDYYEDFDRNTKCSFLLKMIREYCSILTDKEAKVLSFLEKGASQYEIAEAMGVSHQAISLLSISVADKIKAHLKNKSLQDYSYDEVSKGQQSIADFFTPDPKTSPMRDEDKPTLRKFLLDNARGYNSQQVSEVFMNGKYSNRQVAAFAAKNKLYFCILRQRDVYKYSEEENEKILSLFKKGKSCKSVSSIMGISVHSIRGKKSSLVRQKLLSKENDEAVGKS